MKLSSSFFLGIIAERQEHAEKIRRENKCVQWEHVCGDAGYFGKLVQNRLVTYYKNTTFRFFTTLNISWQDLVTAEFVLLSGAVIGAKQMKPALTLRIFMNMYEHTDYYHKVLVHYSQLYNEDSGSLRCRYIKHLSSKLTLFFL